MTPEQRLKYSVAQAFEAVLRKAGYRVLLGGGGGATALGGPRPVKDLDFKMGAQLKAAWQNESKRHELVQTIKSGLEGFGYKVAGGNLTAKKQLKHVLRLEVQDRLSGDLKVRTYGTKEVRKVVNQEKMEISLTSSGVYDEQLHWESKARQALFLHPVDPTQLMLDKVFVFAQRAPNERDKMRTDFEDLAALLEKYEVQIQAELLEVRAQGYKKAAGRTGQESSVTAEARKRIDLIQGDLERPPAWSRLQDPRLRAVEAKFLVARVKRFLVTLDLVLDRLT